MKGLPPLVLAASLLLVQRIAPAAEAAPASARLEVVHGSDASQCIAREALLRAVEVRLQRTAFDERLPPALRVRVELQRSAAGWAAELTMSDGSGALLGRRSLVTAAAHCSALDDSLALVVALLVDSPPSAPTAAESQAERPEPAAQRAPIALPRDTHARREPWRFAISGAGIVALGALPGVAWGAELGLAAKPPRLPELRLFADVYAERGEARAGTSSGARFRLLNLGLELCPLDVGLGAVRWFGCAGQALGRLQVEAYGFDENGSSNQLSYSLLARSGLEIPLFRAVSARLAARAELPLARGEFTYGARDGSERRLFEAKPINAVFDLGLTLQL